MAAEGVLTFAAEGILEKVLSLAEKQFSLAWGFKAELRKLRESFITIKLLLNDVAHKPQAPAIEDWVKKLKGVAEDAEDVLDELEYEGYRRKVQIGNHMKKKVLNFFSISNPLAFRLQMARKIQKINASLVDLKSEASLLRLVSKNKDATSQGIRWDRHSDAFFEKETVGRKDDVSEIVTTLTDSKYNQENLAVMAIVGMGGLGKTTLAKSVYNEDKIHKFFEKKIWICVSDAFDVNFILHQMSEQLNQKKAPSKDNQHTLLLSLDEELKDKKYLLVLDDVWNEDSKLWESFMECLSKLNSAKGSKIIVTTRKDKVALTSERLLPRHVLGKLSGDECWSIMKNRAFTNNSDPKFDTIGREIAENCGGVPLVAKVLGGILRTKKSIEEWSSFKNNKIWNSPSKEEDIIMPILRLSYDNLESSSLKQCFAYCSMFEKLIVCNLEHVKNGEEAKKAKLEDKTKVRHLSFNWTEDRSTTNNNVEEDVLEGLRPHLELESLSIENFMGDKFPTWMMSGLLNNLKKIKLSECNKCEVVPPLGHLPNLTELYIRGIANLKCVGAEFYGYDLVHNVATTSEEIITLFPALKVLHISECGDLNEWKQAPTMSRKKVVVFPFLEKLTVRNCSKLRNAPSHFPFLQKLEMSSCDSRTPIEEMSNGLTTLTSLEISGIKELTCLPPGILKKNNNLHSLVIKNCDDLTCITPDVVGSCGSLKGLVISNCKNLRHLAYGLDTLPLLEGLTIDGCPSLELIQIERGMASLQKLEIKYCGRLSHLPSGLKYCTTLQQLSIRSCDGLSGPLSLWASLVIVSIGHCNNLTSIEIKGSGSLTDSLQKLIIYDCRELTSIPALPQQCPSLQELWINGCPKLSSFGVKSSRAEKEEECISLQSTSDLHTMTSLRFLTIINCERLESWVSSLQFPLSLENLSIRGMPNLHILPSLDHLHSLRTLWIVNCERLESWVSSLQFPLSLETLSIHDMPNLHILPSLDHLRSLRTLSIYNWRNLKYLPTGLQWPTGLQTLRIGGFWEELDSFPDFEVGSLMHLTSLYLYGWPKLKSLPQQIQHLTSLTSLSIESFEGVETLPEWLGSLTSLTYLNIWGGKNLKNLPSVQAMQRLTKLYSLRIIRCHPLLKERCRRDSGTDWPKISHIPDITIYNV